MRDWFPKAPQPEAKVPETPLGNQSLIEDQEGALTPNESAPEAGSEEAAPEVVSFNWRMVESGDYLEYIQNLKRIGVPVRYRQHDAPTITRI